MDTTSMWVSRELVKSLVSFDENNLSDECLASLSQGTLNSIRGLLSRWGFREQDAWQPNNVPASIKRAIAYGTIASLWADRPELFQPSTLFQEEDAMEYWEKRFDNAISQFLRTRGLERVKVRTLISQIKLPF